MPNINLRLSVEEHEALRTWAFEGRRSIQREIIFRLFASDLPKHVKDAITETEKNMIEYVQERAGRDDLVAEMDLTPVTATPESRPDPRLCGMANRHRSRTKASPCPRCGYPL